MSRRFRLLLYKAEKRQKNGPIPIAITPYASPSAKWGASSSAPLCGFLCRSEVEPEAKTKLRPMFTLHSFPFPEGVGFATQRGWLCLCVANPSEEVEEGEERGQDKS